MLNEYLAAIIIGIIEGLTEFLPVSSTGHIILAADLLQFKGPPGKVFEISIQLGAVLAILFSYSRKLKQVMCALGGAGEARQGARQFVLGLLLAFLPAALVGLAFHRFIKEVLFTPFVVSVALIVGGILILIIERCKPAPRTESVEAMGYATAFKIGLFQIAALIPGVSRSGATIMGGLLVGLDRKTATEFSFFLAIPVIGAATLFDLACNWQSLDVAGLELIAVGFIAAFFSALIVVNGMVAFVGRYGFVPFAWYRIVLGVMMLFSIHHGWVN